MALIRCLFENQVGDKHVESLLLPRLDAGSTPASSTFIIHNTLTINYLIFDDSFISQHIVNYFIFCLYSCYFSISYSWILLHCRNTHLNIFGEAGYLGFLFCFSTCKIVICGQAKGKCCPIK